MNDLAEGDAKCSICDLEFWEEDLAYVCALKHAFCIGLRHKHCGINAHRTAGCQIQEMEDEKQPGLPLVNGMLLFSDAFKEEVEAIYPEARHEAENIQKMANERQLLINEREISAHMINSVKESTIILLEQPSASVFMNEAQLAELGDQAKQKLEPLKELYGPVDPIDDVGVRVENNPYINARTVARYEKIKHASSYHQSINKMFGGAQIAWNVVQYCREQITFEEMCEEVSCTVAGTAAQIGTVKLADWFFSSDRIIDMEHADVWFPIVSLAGLGASLVARDLVRKGFGIFFNSELQKKHDLEKTAFKLFCIPLEYYQDLDASGFDFQKRRDRPSLAELNKKYRKLGLTHHPDTKEGSKERFFHLTVCYQMLLEYVKKRDRLPENWFVPYLGQLEGQ